MKTLLTLILLCAWIGAAPAHAGLPGTVVAWGNGQSTIPAGLSRVTGIAGGESHTVALKSDGTVVTWGGDESGQTTIPSGLSNVVAVAAGDVHTVALKIDGTVVAWGGTGYDYGQTTIPPGLSNVAAIAAGRYHTVALKSDGTVVAWGRNNYGQTTVPSGLSNVMAITAGEPHTLALKIDGTLVTWELNFWGLMDIPPGLSNVVAIAAGRYHTVALKNNGTVVTWGNNEYGQTTGTPTTMSPYKATANPVTFNGVVLSGVAAIAAGLGHTVALKSNGTVLAWGFNGQGQTNAPFGLSNVVNIAAGTYHTLAIQRLPPSITAQPVSQSVGFGNLATFACTIITNAVEPLFYQWRFNGVEIPNGTNSTYTIPAVADSDAGIYSVAVTNAVGSVTSSNAVLTVIDSPVFTTQPLSQTVGVGSNVTLSASAYGAQPMVFQWYFNNSPAGSPVSGTNVVFYALSNVETNKSGKYSVQVFNGYGAATSSTAVLSVVVFAPSITMQPSNQNPVLGHSASFAVSVNGTTPFQYQWRYNGANISGATNAAYTIPAVAESDAGNYSVVVANSALSVASANATLTVVIPPTLGLQMLAGYPLLSLSGMQGSNFNVQYNTNLAFTNWFNLLSISNLSAHPYQFLDPAGSSQPTRFYRAIMQ